MILMSSPKGSAIQCQRMGVEVKMYLQMVCQLLSAIFHRLIAVVGPCPFSATLLGGPLVHSSFNLNFISCTEVRFKSLCRQASLPPRQKNKILPAEFCLVVTRFTKFIFS